jgi:hypothetical protein
MVVLLQLLEREVQRQDWNADALLASAMHTLVLCFKLGRRQLLADAVDRWSRHIAIECTPYFDLTNCRAYSTPALDYAGDYVSEGLLLDHASSKQPVFDGHSLRIMHGSSNAIDTSFPQGLPGPGGPGGGSCAWTRQGTGPGDGRDGEGDDDNRSAGSMLF